MSKLQHRQTKIQDKRKQTPWREFVMEICSWFPFNLYKTQYGISRYPLTSRVSRLTKSINYDLHLNEEELYQGNFMQGYSQLLYREGLPLLNDFGGNENADFADGAWNSNSIYLSFTTIQDTENVMYSFHIKDGSKDVVSSVNVVGGSSVVYDSRSVVNSYNIFYSEKIVDSNNVWFSSNLIGCSECIFCDGLQNQSYLIYNKQYSKEEFYTKKQLILSDKSNFRHHNSDNKLLVNSTNVVGDFIVNGSDIESGFDCQNLTGGRNVLFVGSKDDNTNFYDVISAGRSSHFYAVSNSGSYSDHAYCCSELMNCNNVYYSMFLKGCSFCLGCIGLKNKSYCILNKQYSKEEWYQKVDEIFSQMQADGTLGEFFPATMNPFYFNDTAAYLIDPSFTKEEVVAKGYLRRDEAIKVDIPEDAQVVASSELGNYEGWMDVSSGVITKEPMDSSSLQSSEGQHRHINADILKCVIQDDQGNYYRIIPMEYKFLMKHGLPLPRTHWLERMKENFRIN